MYTSKTACREDCYPGQFCQMHCGRYCGASVEPVAGDTLELASDMCSSHRVTIVTNEAANKAEVSRRQLSGCRTALRVKEASELPFFNTDPSNAI